MDKEFPKELFVTHDMSCDGKTNGLVATGSWQKLSIPHDIKQQRVGIYLLMEVRKVDVTKETKHRRLVNMASEEAKKA